MQRTKTLLTLAEALAHTSTLSIQHACIITTTSGRILSQATNHPSAGRWLADPNHTSGPHQTCSYHAEVQAFRSLKERENVYLGCLCGTGGMEGLTPMPCLSAVS